MAQQVKAPKFGNWETAESVPYTQYFDQARSKKHRKTIANPNGGTENSEIVSTDVQSLVDASSSKTGSSLETTKPKDPRPSMKDVGNINQTDTPVSNEGVVCKPDIKRRSNRTHGGYQGKSADRAANDPPPSGKKIASEGTPGRIRTTPGDRAGITPLRDVTVPPFAEWDENDPASGEKYTGIFKIIADNRRSPGPPYEPPQPRGQEQESTGTKVRTSSLLSLY
ncbi:hypothetical protein B296_00027655 [Ensete ventricosum]|uniref:RIN4 pathogenic type III effector avirulence factor Avr cleavage site domain-containing protein n=1 Tax=Ensete ventricosum TaxID=4639 RepID=A0A427APE9_ENSVE|nr:hypothetical protein B296_00027655 [Ensete ventricosum]